MSYTNRKFNWDFNALNRFYRQYVVKWLNSAVSWTAGQKKQARANLGFGDGDIDSEPTPDSERVVTSGGVASVNGYYDVNPEWIRVLLDANERVLGGIKADGSIEWSKGVPTPIKEYVERCYIAKEDGKSLIISDFASRVSYEENPEWLKVELDADGRVLSGTKVDGSHYFYMVETETLKDYVEKEEGKSLISADYAEGISTTEDVENRLELKLDSEERIISERKGDGTLVEPVGIETKKVVTDMIELSEEGLVKLNKELSLGYSDKIKKYNLPKYGTVNIKSEIFYLPAGDWSSYADDLVLIQVNEDTDDNAKEGSGKNTLSFFYIKSSVINNGDGTYSLYDDGVEGHDVKLDFYAAGEVSKIGNSYYVKSSLEDGEPVASSIEVIQCTDVPPYKAWTVKKKIEHFCLVDIDFGNYLNKTDAPIGVKYQGTSTLWYRKRNFRFTFYKSNAKPYYPVDGDKFGKKNKTKIGEMVRCSGFNLKANFTSQERIKEHVMNILLMSIWDNRDIANRYPWDTKVNPYTGATGMIKGFPIRVDIGGEFYGVDIFGLKKDEANYCLDGDETGMLVAGTEGNWRNRTNWTNARWQTWEDEINDEMSESNQEALTLFFDFINSRMYKSENGDECAASQITEIDGSYYTSDALMVNGEGITATRTSDAAYIGNDGNLYIISELTEINDVLYVTSTLSDGEPTQDSVIATEVGDGHNIYLGSDGKRYLSQYTIVIDGERYVRAKAEPVPFDHDTMPEKMSIVDWIDYIICLQVFLMRDNTCRNMMLYSDENKCKFYPYFYDLDLDWNFYTNESSRYDIMVPADPTGQHITGSYAGDMSLWENFKNAYWDEIRNRYFELRQSLLTIPYMTAVCKSVSDYIPSTDISLEQEKWGNGTFDMSNKLLAMKKRLEWLDEYYNQN